MILNWLVGAYMPNRTYNEHPQILSTENMILLHCSLESVTYQSAITVKDGPEFSTFKLYLVTAHPERFLVIMGFTDHDKILSFAAIDLFKCEHGAAKHHTIHHCGVHTVIR